MKYFMMTLALGLSFATSQAFAANNQMSLDCRLTSTPYGGGTKIQLLNGTPKTVACERSACPDYKDWNVKMTYNGTDTVAVEVTHGPSMHYADVNFHNLVVGSKFEMQVGAKNAQGRQTDKYFGVLCDVEAIQ